MRFLTILLALCLTLPAQQFPSVGLQAHSGGGGSLTQVQTKTYLPAAAATTHTLTFTNTPVQNNLLVFAAVCDDAETAISSGWTLALAENDFTDSYIYYKIAGVSEPKTVQITVATSVNCVLGGVEYSGNVTSTPLDKTVGAIGQGGAGSIAPGTTAATTTANELIVSLAGMSTSTVTVTSWSASMVSVFGTIVNVDAGTKVSLDMAVKIVSSTGTQTTTATLSSSVGNSSGLICTFKGT